MVVAASSHHRSPGSIPRRSRIYSPLLQIASTESRSLRGASHQPAFMSSYLNVSHTQNVLTKSRRVKEASHQPALMRNYLIISNTFYCPIYLVHQGSWCAVVYYDWANGDSVSVFFRHGVVSSLWGELVLF